MKEPAIDDRPFWRVLFPAALVALLVSYLLRRYWEPLHGLYGTYPSDIWYMHINYSWFLVHHGYFGLEYPAGMFAFVKAMSVICWWAFPHLEPGKHGGEMYAYQDWLLVNSLALGAAALGLVWCMHRLDREFFRLERGRLLIAFVATPSFVFFTLFNYDVLPILCCVAAFLALLRRDEPTAFMLLGVGTAVKIFPAVLVPLFLLPLPRGRWLPNLGWFASACAVINVPFLILNPEAWIFPYTWQMEFDNADQTGRLLYTLTGLLGKLPALALVGGAGLGILYLVWRKAPREPLAHPRWMAQASLLLVGLFIFTKNVFSPQYLFWLLPYAALGTAFPFWGLGTAIELVNIAEAFRLDYWRGGHVEGLEAIRAIREVGMAVFLVYTVRRLRKPESEPEGPPKRGRKSRASR